jgi:2'-5' RNA ligase
VALDLPAGTRGGLAAWAGARLGTDERLRLVPEESLHVTLVFLGSVDARRVGELWEAVAGASEGHPAARLEPRVVAALPRRRPRVLALDLGDDAGAVASLQEDVADALVTAGLAEPERRRWRPHVTVARVRRGGEGGVTVPDPPSLAPFTASGVTLYRSRPGSDYEALERLALLA